MAKILVSGSLAYDRIMDFPGYFRDSLIPDKLDDINVSFTVDGLSECFGGTAGNIAYNLAILGEEPEILSTAGNNFEEYRKWLINSRVETRSISIAKELRTAEAYVVTDKGESQISIFHSGALAQAWSGTIPNAELAIVSPGNIADMLALTKEYRKRRTPYFFDAGQQISVLTGDDLRGAILGASVFFGNEYEMGLMMEKSGWDMKKLLEEVPIVVTTRGTDGSRITTRDGNKDIKAILTGKSVDPTGAGDAHRAGFAKGYLMKLSLEKTGRLASAVASLNSG